MILENRESYFKQCVFIHFNAFILTSDDSCSIPLINNPIYGYSMAFEFYII